MQASSKVHAAQYEREGGGAAFPLNGHAVQILSQ